MTAKLARCVKLRRLRYVSFSDLSNEERKVDSARARRPHTMSYGDFNFGPVRASADGADKRTGLKADRPVLRCQSSRGELVRLILAMGRPLLDR